MTPDAPEVTDFLTGGMTARIATISRTGRPHVNPLYFVCGHGFIYLGTTDRTLAARNVRADPRVSILFAREYDDSHTLLRVTGLAAVHTEFRINLWYAPRDLRKYILTRRGIANTAAHLKLLPLVFHFVTAGHKGRPCVIEVRPQDVEFISTE